MILWIKGSPKQRPTLAWKQEMSKCSRLQVLYCGHINIHATQVLFFIHSLLMISKTTPKKKKKKKKRLACDTIYLFLCVEFEWEKRQIFVFMHLPWITVLLYFTTGTNLIMMSQKQTASHKNVSGHSRVFVTSESLLSFLFLLFFNSKTNYHVSLTLRQLVHFMH